jgi:hypothetical protein
VQRVQKPALVSLSRSDESLVTEPVRAFEARRMLMFWSMHSGDTRAYVQSWFPRQQYGPIRRKDNRSRDLRLAART